MFTCNLEKVVPMNTRFLAVGALAMLAAHAANATVYFDSVNVTNPQAGFDGLSDGTAAMANSFTVPTQNFNQVSLLLAAGTPSDGGSASVFLVPDNGTGSLAVAGSPTAAFSSGNVFSSFTGAQLLGVIKELFARDDGKRRDLGVARCVSRYYLTEQRILDRASTLARARPLIGISAGRTTASGWQARAATSPIRREVGAEAQP